MPGLLSHVRAITVTSVAAIVLVASTLPAGGASSSAVVQVTVATATNLDVSGCATGSAAASFGTVTPGTGTVTSADCVVTFGSSNGTAALRIGQQDTVGDAMFQPSTGDVDTGFGGGLVSSHFNGNDYAFTMAVQPDGKLLVGGYTDSVNGGDVLLARYRTDGTLDPAFGVNGFATWTDGNYDGIEDIAVQPDGKIVVTGYHTFSDMSAVRFDANGSLDTTFASGGRFRHGGSGSYAEAVLSRRDGTVLLAGATGLTAGGNATGDASIVAVSGAGAVLGTFGSSGRTTIPAAASGKTDFATELHEQTDRKLVVTGNAYRADETTLDIFAARLGADGQLDGSFGSGGLVTIPVGSPRDPGDANGTSNSRLVPSSLQRDDRLLVAFATHLGSGVYDTVVRRLTTSGLPDPTFGTSGAVTLDLGPTVEAARFVLEQPDGRILVGSTVAGGDLLVTRLHPGGTVDTSFGSSGILNASFAGQTSPFRRVPAVQGHDGKLYVASDHLNATVDFGVRAYVGSPVANYGAGNDWATAAAPFFGACLRAVGASTTASWAPAGTCGTSDTGSIWRAVPAATSQVALAASNTTTATASLRFGMRAAPSQRQGIYVAPVAFEVAAP